MKRCCQRDNIEVISFFLGKYQINLNSSNVLKISVISRVRNIFGISRKKEILFLFFSVK